MRNAIAIARKEILSAFVTPLAYVVIAGFILISGFFFFSLLQHFNSTLRQAAMFPGVNPNLNEWVVGPFYQTLEIVLVFLVPILTMRSVAEERQRGTFELLMTSPVSVADVVWGKFIGVGIVAFLMLAASFVFPFFLLMFANPEAPPIVVGFLGLLLFTLAFVSLGVAISTFTKSQAVAGVVSLVLMLLYFVIDAPASKLKGPVADVLTYLSPVKHAEPFLRGVIDAQNVIYFLSVIFVGLFVAGRALDAERWR